jgi:hypothetical protein
MTISSISSGGRMILGDEVLAHLGVGPGDSLAPKKLPAGRIRLWAENGPGTSIVIAKAEGSVSGER